MTTEPAILVCVNRRLDDNTPSCAARGSEALVTELREAVAARGWPVRIDTLRCLGECQRGPALRLFPGGRFFHEVSSDSLNEVLEALRLLLARDASRNAEGGTDAGAPIG